MDIIFYAIINVCTPLLQGIKVHFQINIIVKELGTKSCIV